MSAPAYVQNTEHATTAATNTAAYASAQTLHDVNLVFIGWDPSTGVTVSSVTDTKGNTYNLQLLPDGRGVANAYAASNGVVNWAESLYVATNIASATGGANTVTVTFSASIASNLLILEYNNCNTVSPLDGFNFQTSSCTLAPTGQISTSQASDTIVAHCFGLQASPTLTAPVGFTSRYNTSSQMVADGPAATAGFYVPSFTLSVQSWLTCIGIALSNSAATAKTNIPCVALYNPGFTDAYPPRFKENIYDSLGSNPGFTANIYGPPQSSFTTTPGT